MKQRTQIMVKSISIALILFSTSICFSQNSDNRMKETTSATSKTIAGEDTKAPLTKAHLKEEIIGRPAFVDLGTPILGPNSSPPKGNENENENSDQKKSINGKNVAKPH